MSPIDGSLVARYLNALRFLVMAALAAQGGAVAANEALIKKHGCLGCHAKDLKLVGPAFTEVAQRYKGQADATTELALRIRSGGAGKWGDMAMPPQAQLSAAQAKQLATWVLALSR